MNHAMRKISWRVGVLVTWFATAPFLPVWTFLPYLALAVALTMPHTMARIGKRIAHSRPQLPDTDENWVLRHREHGQISSRPGDTHFYCTCGDVR